MFMVMANTKTGRDLDREYQLRKVKEAEEQKMHDQLTAMEQERKENIDGMQDEVKEQMTKSLLGPGVDDAVADIFTLDYDAIVKELEIQKDKVNPKLLKAKLLKDITGAAQVKGSEVKVNYDFAVTMANHIYNGKIDLIKLIPPNQKLIEIKTLLLTAIKKTNFKEFRSYDPNGLDMFLEGQLDQPTLFVIFTDLFRKFCLDLSVIDDAIDEYIKQKNKPTQPSAVCVRSI
jgi:hypothetical protein